MAMSWISNVQERKLANGLTLLVQPVPGLPAAALVTRVGAGFFDEPDRVQGISHVLEHMFFKGTPTRGVGQIARDTKALGGYLNAGTAYDYTVYYTVLPARALAQAIAIQSDALRRPLFDQDELTREIEVIIEEAKRKLDTPSAVTQETLHAELYDHHRIRRWRIGTEDVLRTFKRDDLVEYYRTRYVPARTVVCVAGGVDAAATLDALEAAYGDWEAGPGEADRSPAEPDRRGLRARTLRGDVRQADLIVGWRGVPALHPDGPALDLAAATLSAGRSSRLYRALREPGVVGSVSAFNYSPTEVGVFGVAMDLAPDRIPEALSGVGREVTRLAGEVPDPESLELARTLLKVRWARRFESADGRAMELASAHALGGLHLLDEEYAALLATAPEQVRDAVRRHLLPDAVAAVAYLPRDRGEDLKVEGLGVAFSGPNGQAVRRSVRPSVAGVHHALLPAADILAYRHRGAPLVTVGLYRRRLAFDPPARAGLAVLSVRSAVRGAGSFDAPGLALAFERLGGSLAPSVNPEWYGYQATVLPDHLAEAGRLLELVLRAPRLESASIAIERDLLADDAAQAADDMFRRPAQLAAEAAFGAAGYGLPLHGSPASVRDLVEGDVWAWHEEQRASGRTTAIVVGDVDPEAALDLLGPVLDGNGRQDDVRPGPAPQASSPDRTRVESRDKKQTAFAMQFPGPTRLDRSRFAAEVWAAFVGGLGGRLFEALRDQRSLAYSVAAWPWQRRRIGALVTYIATTPEREAEARDAMLAELAGLRAAPPPAEDISRSTRYLAGQAEVSRQRAGAVLGEILEAWLEGDGLAELEDPVGPYLAVGPDDVAQVMQRYLDPEGRAEGIVRGSPS
jgi:zinc protease